MSLKKLGRYDLVRVLGKGAMGIVYEGRDPNLDRRVAIKTVKVENLSEEAAAEYEARFRTEARSAARLQHPNIVSVYDSDRDGDIAFLVMEYIQGDDLKHYLDKGIRYSLEQSLKMIRDLLSALDYAHKQGIVHRDIKPANLLIEPGGRVKLTDFGVARIQNSGEATRTQGSMVGTLKYMSPEQVQGQKIDSRADLFSVGVVLYQLLTDKRPFDGDNDFSIIHQIIGHTPPPPSSFNGAAAVRHRRRGRPRARQGPRAAFCNGARFRLGPAVRDTPGRGRNRGSAGRSIQEKRRGGHGLQGAPVVDRTAAAVAGDRRLHHDAGNRAGLLEGHQGLDRSRRTGRLPGQSSRRASTPISRGGACASSRSAPAVRPDGSQRGETLAGRRGPGSHACQARPDHAAVCGERRAAAGASRRTTPLPLPPWPRRVPPADSTAQPWREPLMLTGGRAGVRMPTTMPPVPTQRHTCRKLLPFRHGDSTAGQLRRRKRSMPDGRDSAATVVAARLPRPRAGSRSLRCSAALARWRRSASPRSMMMGKGGGESQPRQRRRPRRSVCRIRRWW